MHNEEEKICGKAVEVEKEDPAFALQLRLYWGEHLQYNNLHWRHLFAIRKLKGYDCRNNYYFTPGTHVAMKDTVMATLARDLDTEDVSTEGRSMRTGMMMRAITMEGRSKLERSFRTMKSERCVISTTVLRMLCRS